MTDTTTMNEAMSEDVFLAVFFAVIIAAQLFMILDMIQNIWAVSQYRTGASTAGEEAKRRWVIRPEWKSLRGWLPTGGKPEGPYYSEAKAKEAAIDLNYWAAMSGGSSRWRVVEVEREGEV